MMDFNNTPVENPFIAIGSLNYSPIAKAHINLKDIVFNFKEWDSWIKSLEYYSPIETIQDMDYAWYPGATLYKLITDDNKVFILANLVVTDSIRSPADIELAASNLGKKLNLPTGWRFETSKLEKILQLKQRQFDKIPTTHLQDEFGNLYIHVKLD